MKTVLCAGVLAAAALGAAGGAGAEPKPGEQQPCELNKQITITITARYLLYLPEGYETDAGKRWPLVLFLHGAGERGSDLEKVKAHGPPRLVAAGKQFPFILVSPQCPEDARWSTDTLGALLDDVRQRYRVDPDRVYVTGLSMGGYGTWAMAMAYPDRFAAIAPICGGGDPRRAARIRGVPAWVFHGGKDTVVPLQQSEEMVAALKAAGAPEVKLTVYPDAGHDSWTMAYDDPALYEWLLGRRRRAPSGATAPAPGS